MRKKRKILSISDVITNSSSEVFLIDGKNIVRKKASNLSKDKILDKIIDIAAECRSKDYGNSDWKTERSEIIKYQEISLNEDWESMYQLFLECYVAPDKRDEFTEEDFLKLFPYIYSVEDAKKRIISIRISDGLAELIENEIKPFTLDKKLYAAIYSILYPSEHNFEITNKIDKFRNENN